MALTDRERQQVRDLIRTTPLSFKWTQGTRLPDVSTKEMVFFENEELESMRVGVRRGQKTYWLFTGTVADDDDQDSVGNINLLRHAKRHVTSTYATTEDLQTNTDPITAYKFTWTGEHTFTPAAVDRVPITINAMTDHTANLVAIVNKDDNNSTIINAESQHSLGDATQTAILNVKSSGGGFLPSDLSSLEAWYDASLETGNNGDPVTTMTDRSSNGHDMTAGGTSDPTIVTNWQNSLRGVGSSMTSASYFRQDTPFNLTDSFTIVWIGKNTQATQRPMFFGNTAIYTGTAYNVPTWKRNSLNGAPPDPWNTDVPRWAEPGNSSPAGAAINNYWLTSTPAAHTGIKYVHAMVVTRTSPTDWQVTTYNFNGIDKSAVGTTLIPDNDLFIVDYVLTYPQQWGEMCLFNAALSADDVESVENYLATKWNFTYEGAQDTELAITTPGFDIFSGEDSDGDRRVHIDSNGKVGFDGAATIGLDPSVRLHVRDESTPQVIVDYDVSNQLQIAVASDGDVTMTASTDFTLTAGGDLVLIPAADEEIIMHSDSGALVYVKDDRVGIGTDSPDQLLHIESTGTAARISYDDSNYTEFAQKADGTLFINPTGAASHVFIGDSYTDISQDKGLIVQPHIYAQAADTVSLFGFIIGTTEKANIRYYDATDDLRFTDGAANVRFAIADNNATIGASDTDTKTLTFADSGSDGTISYDGTNITLNKIAVGVDPDTAPSKQLATVDFCDGRYLKLDCSNDPLTGDLELGGSLTFPEMAAPGTPAANDSVVYLDSTIGELVTKKDTGDVHNLERSMGVISAYIDVKARNKAYNLNGNFENLVTAGAVSSGSPQAATAGIGKLVIIVNAGADTSGTLTVTGTKVDRDDGTETGSFADDLTISGTTTDTSTTDAAGNTVWGFSNAYITSVWFTGSVSISTTDVDLSDIDIYQVAFEQFNDEADTTIETADATAYANNGSAWYYAHAYKITVSDDTCTIASIVDIAWPAAKVTANTPYRWRRSISTDVDGTTDGIWGEHFFGPLPNNYWEDIDLKLWFSQSKKE